MSGNRITGLPTRYGLTRLPASGSDAASYSQVIDLVRDAATECANKVSKNGDVMEGNLYFTVGDDNTRSVGCNDMYMPCNSFGGHSWQI